MAALTAGRDTARKYLERHRVAPIAATTKLYAGGMVCLNAAGFAVPASDSAGLVNCLGRAEDTVDNTGADGALSVTIACGVFKYDNSSGNAIGQTDVGSNALVEDDQTVAISSTNSVVAGEIEEIDADGGIWIKVL